jgi:hypothetical protein
MQTYLRHPIRAAVLLLTAAILVAATPAQAARIAVLSNKYFAETAADFNGKIPSHTFTAFNTANGPPAAATLQQFDAILLFEDTTFDQAPNVGTAVAAFARSGKAVVLGTFYDQDRSDGPAQFSPHGWGDLENIDPNTTDGVGTAYTARTLGATVAHPLTVGVTALTAQKLAGGNQAKPATIVVATWAEKNARGGPDPAIAYRITGAACVIHVAIAPDYPSVGVLNTDFGGDYYRVWRNAFDFASSHCITGTTNVPINDAFAIPATSLPVVAMMAALLGALAWYRLRRRPVRR